MELPNGSMVGEYEVLGRLGQGAMGTVYAGVHPLIGTKVAIKVLHPEAFRDPVITKRFVQEARAVNEIGHPNIVRIFSFGNLEDGVPYFVMERLPGQSLGELLQERTRLSPGEAASLLEPIARAMDSAHDSGVIHRDLKPDNIFIIDLPDGGKDAKVLDFGVAKLADSTMASTTSTVGTPLFMAPEQCLARGPVDKKVDVYAFGVLAFHALTGRFPLEAESLIALASLHLEGKEPTPPSTYGAPEALDGPILSCLERDPAARPQSLEEAHRAIAAAARNERPAPSNGPDAAEDRSEEGQTRRRLLLGIGAVAVVGAAAFFLLSTGDHDETAAEPIQASTRSEDIPSAGEPVAKPLEAKDAAAASAEAGVTRTDGGSRERAEAEGRPQHDLVGAEKTAERATAERLVERADQASEDGRCDDAMRLYRRVLRQNPRHLGALTSLGYCLIEADRFSSAQANFRAALAIRPRYAPALWGVAEAYLQQRRKQKAIEAFRTFLELHPKSKRAGLAKRTIERLKTPPSGAEEGTLDPAEIRRAYRKHSFLTQRCYERALKRNPELDVPSTRVHISISPVGKVSKVSVPSLTKKEEYERLGQCLKARIKRWEFPRSAEGLTTTFPLVFAE